MDLPCACPFCHHRFTLDSTFLGRKIECPKCSYRHVAEIRLKCQCPSCQSSVLVKDASLIGQKVECSACKYRFVVSVTAPTAAAKERATTTVERTPTGIRCRCPSCDTLLGVPDPAQAGNQFQCPKCSYRFVVKTS